MGNSFVYKDIKSAKFGSLSDPSIDRGYIFTSWSFVHAASGFALALLCYLLRDHVSYRVSAFLSVLGIVLWEPLEHAYWVEEAVLNAVADVWIGVSTFLMGLILAGAV